MRIRDRRQSYTLQCRRSGEGGGGEQGCQGSKLEGAASVVFVQLDVCGRTESRAQARARRVCPLALTSPMAMPGEKHAMYLLFFPLSTAHLILVQGQGQIATSLMGFLLVPSLQSPIAPVPSLLLPFPSLYLFFPFFFPSLLFLSVPRATSACLLTLEDWCHLLLHETELFAPKEYSKDIEDPVSDVSLGLEWIQRQRGA